MFPFDAILFDVGGVLLTNGWDPPRAREGTGAVSCGPRRHRGLASGVLPRLGAGRHFRSGYLDATVFYQPRGFSHDQFFHCHAAPSRTAAQRRIGNPKELAASDRCLLGALNNESRETNEYRFRNLA